MKHGKGGQPTDALMRHELESFAHELGNYLQVITGGVRLAAKQAGEDPVKARSQLERVYRVAQRAQELVAQLRSLAPGSPLALRTIDLSSQIEELRGVVSSWEDPNLRLRVSIAKDLPKLRCDPARIWQALLNLVLNARDAMPGGGILSLCLRKSRNGEAIELRVSDSGKGIPIKLRKKIFEPAFTTRSEHAGRGMGLAVVQSVVAAHGGEILLESERGKGSCFCMRLPLGVAAKKTADQKAAQTGA